MLSQSKIKYIRSLSNKKFRIQYRQFIVEGTKSVKELLNSNYIADSIYATKDWINNHSDSSVKINPIEISENEMGKISQLTTPQNVLGIFNIPDISINNLSLSGALTLMLDDIKDPGNMGTIIRIADWFGIKQIICSPKSVDIYNPKVVQGSMGSIARVNVAYANLLDILQNKSENIPVYGALLDGENIYKTTLESSGIIIIGNESEGISENLLPHISKKIMIPSFNTNLQKAESLNAAIAAGIICAEFRRRAI